MKIKQQFENFEKTDSIFSFVWIIWNMKQFCSDPVELIYQKC